VLDVNATQDGRGANFHYAFLEWTWKDLSVGGGLVALAQFAEQEAFWGRRYVEKSFQDLYGFGPDSDLGIILKYRLTSWLEADAALVNGSDLAYAEGIRMNRFAWGLTSRPLAGLRLRAYFDVNRYSDITLPGGPAPAYANQSSVALFAGYKNEFFSIGAEYNQQMAKDFNKGNDYFGLSLYGGLALGRKFDLYARYDYVDTESPSGQAYDWASVANETMWIAGLAYHPVKNLQISPNYRYRRPVGGEGAHFIGLNVGFSL
jgi:opacity protein-like surface antigen